LHAEFYGKHGPPLSWEQYRRKYLEEMDGREELIAKLASRFADAETITLLCSSACVDADRCHRTLLKELIEKRGRRNAAK
jgi:uncharacterized protein YeaO (DUF488 family)